MTLFLDDPPTTQHRNPTRSEEPSAVPEPGADWPPLFPARPLTALVVTCLAVIGGSASLIGAAGWADIHPFPFIGAGVAVLIAGLVARSYRGGGRFMLPFGLLMLLAVSVAAITGPYLDEGTGDRRYRPAGFAQLADGYEFGIGDATFDFRDVDFPEGTHTVAVEMGIGHAIVWVPADIDVQVVGDLEVGKIDVFEETAGGFGNRLAAVGPVGADATLLLDVEMEIGYLEVRRG